MEARGGGFVSRRGLVALRSRGGGSQGLILSPVRRVPRALPLRSAGPQAPVSAPERSLRHGIPPLSAAASCRRGFLCQMFRLKCGPGEPVCSDSRPHRPAEVQLILWLQAFLHAIEQDGGRACKKPSLPQNQLTARIKLTFRIPTKQIVSRP